LFSSIFWRLGFVFRHCRHDVFGQIDEDGARPPGAGDMKSLVDRLGQLVHPFDEEVVLRTWTGDADDIDLLEGVGPDEVGGDLAG